MGFFGLAEQYWADAMTHLIEAKKHFEESINTRVTDYLEYDLSQAELSRAFQGVR